MPWMEESKVEQRLRFVIEVREEGVSVAEACRQFNISRPTGYKWLRRYDDEGLDGLEDQSRVPDTIPHKTDEEVEQLICSLREQYPNLGPKKLRAWLRREHPDRQWPAASTIGEILKRNDLVDDRDVARKPPPRSEPLEEADEPNAIWSADFKGQFELGDGSMCFPLTITDNYSRMLLGCQALPSTSGGPVKSYFRRVFDHWGLPDAIRTDNGAPFASTAPRGLTKLSAWWVGLGIDHQRTDPGEPQQNGRHERMHLTLKEHTARPGEETMAAQQETFDSFRGFFNQLRPHEALDQTPPANHHQESRRPFTDSPPSIDYSTCDLTRKVKSTGQIQVADERFYITEALSGFRVGLTEVAVDVWVVTFADKDVGYFEPGDKSISALRDNESVKRMRF